MTRQAIRYFLKTLRSELGSTLITIVTLALAIAANTAIFAVGNALLFKKLPGVSESQRLVNIGRTMRGSGFDSLSYPDYVDFRDRNSVFSGVAAYTMGETELGLGGNGSAERVSGLFVTENLFEVLGTTPVLGRFFNNGDAEPSASPVAVISYDLWKTRFGGDADILSRQIFLNGRPVSIIGVTEEGAHGPDLRQISVLLPLQHRGIARGGISGLDLMRNRSSVWLEGIARLKPGISVQRADADIRVIASQLESGYPDSNRNRGASVLPYFPVPGQHTPVQLFLTILLAIVALVLVIACANIAGLGLARATARKREVALRLALGAGRRRIVAQLLVETVVLFAVAGSLGLLMAWWITEMLYGMRAELPVAIAIDLSPDWTVVLFTLGATLAAALFSGLTPALSVAQTDLNLAIKEESATATSGRSGLRRALVLAQVGLSLVLLITAALFLRTLTQADLRNPGFVPANVEVASIDFTMAGFDESQGRRFGEDLLSRLQELPGVESAALAHDLPLNMSAFGIGGINVDGHEPPLGAPVFSAEWNIVSPGFFRTIQLPLVRGRDFAESDRGSPQVAIVNQTMARRFWPNEDPIGKRFYRGPASQGNVLEIIGVAGDTQNRTLGDRPVPFIYVPLNQIYNSSHYLVVRNSNGANVGSSVRDLLRNMNPNLPIVWMRSMDQVIGFSLLPQRAAALIVGAMGLMGLLLASIGIYGVTAQTVTSRTREIGIRMALGAGTPNILRAMLREGILLAILGLGIGFIGAAVVGQVIRGYLYSIGPLDLIAFTGATATLVAAVLVATYLPARRATKVDPMVALRHE